MKEPNSINPYFQYYKLAVDTLGKYVPKREITTEGRVDLLNNPQFKSLMEVFPGILCIFNFPTRSYNYMSENVKEILGFTAKEFYDHGLEKTASLFPDIHKGIILQKIFPTMFDYFERHSIIGDVKDLRIAFNSLVFHSDGSLHQYLHQMNVIHTEASKPNFILKLITNISSIKKDNGISMTISQKNDKGIYFPIYTQNFISDLNSNILSSRESEILNLISQGKSSAEVGDLLCISENTVYKHRKNMLKKMDAKNTGELLSKAISQGLI